MYGTSIQGLGFTISTPFAASPDDLLRFEFHSNVPMSRMVTDWHNITGPGNDQHDQQDYVTGFTDYSHTFSFSNSATGIDMITDGSITFAFVLWGLNSQVSIIGAYALYLSGDACSGIADGRLCAWDDYAIYTDNDSIDVYGIENSEGYLVASVSQSDLDAHPGRAGTNTLIADQRGIMFYRLENSDVYEVHVGPYQPGLAKFVRFTGLPGEYVFCGVVRQ